jgi:tRNA-dihydrouridine synthase A
VRTPALVGECVAALKSAVAVPVTVKCRIGVDDQDPETALDALADAVLAAGADALWVHARKAWLSGLSPKENREIPPLDYERVRRLKRRLPATFVGLNGGIVSLDQAERELGPVDGVMIGRLAYHEPGQLAAIDRRFYGATTPDPDPVAVAESMMDYAAEVIAAGGRLGHITRHMLGLFHGRPGARRYRQILTVEAARPGAGVEVIAAALSALPANGAAAEAA